MRISLLLALALTACSARAKPPTTTPPPHAPTLAVRTDRAPTPRALMPPQDAAVALFQLLNQERESRHTAPLRIDRGLALVAQTTAGEYRRVGRGGEADLLAAEERALAAFNLTFPVLRSVVIFVEDLEQAPGHLKVREAALDPEMHWVGLAVVHSPPPVGPRGGYGVVLALGQ